MWLPVIDAFSRLKIGKSQFDMPILSVRNHGGCPES